MASPRIGKFQLRQSTDIQPSSNSFCSSCNALKNHLSESPQTALSIWPWNTSDPPVIHGVLPSRTPKHHGVQSATPARPQRREMIGKKPTARHIIVGETPSKLGETLPDFTLLLQPVCFAFLSHTLVGKTLPDCVPGKCFQGQVDGTNSPSECQVRWRSLLKRGVLEPASYHPFTLAALEWLWSPAGVLSCGAATCSW